MKNTIVRVARLTLLAAVMTTSACGDGNGDGGGGGVTYQVTAGVVEAVGRLGALQFQIEYLGDSGAWMGHGASVACEVLTDGLAASNYPGASTVKIGLVSLQGFQTPDDIVRCLFHSEDHPEPGDFEVEVSDASDIHTNALPQLPSMAVVRVAVVE